MAFRVPPFVWENASSPGTTAITTTGTVTTLQKGALPFASGGVGASDGKGPLVVGDTFPYKIQGQTTGNSEMGVGTVTAISGNTMTWSRAPIFPASGVVDFTETCDIMITEFGNVGFMPHRSGLWYTNRIVTPITTGTVGASQIIAYPIDIPAPGIYTDVGFQSQSASLSAAEIYGLGIVHDVGGFPDTTVLDQGTVTVPTTTNYGNYSYTFGSPLPFPQGTAWVLLGTPATQTLQFWQDASEHRPSGSSNPGVDGNAKPVAYAQSWSGSGTMAPSAWTTSPTLGYAPLLFLLKA